MFIDNTPLNLITTVTATSTTITKLGVHQFNASGGAITATIDTELCKAGAMLVIKNVANDTTGISVATEGAETLDGGATKACGGTAYLSTMLYSDGSNWFTL
jgi:hypothetical protein